MNLKNKKIRNIHNNGSIIIIISKEYHLLRNDRYSNDYDYDYDYDYHNYCNYHVRKQILYGIFQSNLITYLNYFNYFK